MHAPELLNRNVLDGEPDGRYRRFSAFLLNAANKLVALVGEMAGPGRNAAGPTLPGVAEIGSENGC